jgi:hypothetical protein
LYNSKINETICDFLRSEIVLDKNLTGQEEAKNNNYQPSIITCVDSRSDIGKHLLSHETKTVELCWFFTLTKEKYRLKSTVNVLEFKTGNEESKEIVQKIWGQQSEDELLSFKRPWPGTEKVEIKDELQKYEPQVEDEIPDNFKIIQFIPLSVDHYMYAPPPVIADARRKPQEYESLAQPFKKDRRFMHTFDDNNWNIKEINP